jgi:periplasmic protein TonB
VNVFDEVTKREGGRQAARRAGYVMGSTAFQIALVFAIIAIGTVRATVKEDTVVDVKFVRPAAPPPPPPPPAPPAARKRPPSDEKPRTDLPKPPPPQALLQPKEVQEEIKINPNEPKEPEYDYSGSASDEGVIGGVVGAQPSIEDAPQFATAGYVKPRQESPNCAQNAVRVPPQLQGFISGPITVKFAVRKDGSLTQFQVMSNIPDKRIGDLIWQAIQSCKWVPGNDPQGRPTSVWVILPFRFVSG